MAETEIEKALQGLENVVKVSETTTKIKLTITIEKPKPSKADFEEAGRHRPPLCNSLFMITRRGGKVNS